MKQALLPRVSYRATIAGTNEITSHLVESAEVMFAEVMANKLIAEATFDDVLRGDVTVDPVTDSLTMTFDWASTGNNYMTVVAHKHV